MYQSQEIKIGGMLEELCKLEEGIKMAEATLFRVTDEEKALVKQNWKRQRTYLI